MRILLSKKSRKSLFEFLMKKYDAKNLRLLASKMGVPFKTLEKWRYGPRYLPKRIIPEEMKKLRILDEQQDNWGSIKGGSIGGRRCVEILKKRLGERGYSKLMKQRGHKNIKVIWKRYGKEELMKRVIKGKIKKRELETKKLEQENSSFFTNKKILLNPKEVEYSRIDKRKGINFPKEMSKELAEEIGIHLGDGCMSYKRNYFSVKTNLKEEAYVINFLFPLYKRLFNIDLKVRKTHNVIGFEIYSKAVCEFKNKIINIPYGEKLERIEVPKSIIDTKNKEIYCSFIRGLFDTDGCVFIRNERYPKIFITIKSKKLIDQVENMLKKLGFISYVYQWTITLNGPTMLKKWIKEINSNNSKNINKLIRANSLVDRIFPCGL